LRSGSSANPGIAAIATRWLALSLLSLTARNPVGDIRFRRLL
jgi:hypothetical protein